MLGSKWAAYVSGATSTVQLHVIPLGGAFLSVCLLSGCAAIGALRYIRELLRYPWFILTGVLFAIQFASLFWSPSIRVGVREIGYQLPFVFLSLAMLDITRKDLNRAVALLKLTLALTVIQAFMVILFRLDPTLKLQFFSSVVAYPFESANRLADFANSETFNITDPTKSGGLFIYPNPTAAWLGLCSLSSWHLSRAYDIRFLKFVAGFDLLAVLFTGSKAGVFAACVVIGLLCILHTIQNRKLELRYAIAICFSTAFFAAAVFIVVMTDSSQFFDQSTDALSSREIIWTIAKEEFQLHAVQGLGYGGWERVVPIIGRYVGIPPHNAFIVLWAQSGLFAVVVGALFALSFLWWTATRALRGAPTEQTIAIGLFGAYLWLFIQSQAENFGLFGEDHMKPILALMTGFLAGMRLLPATASLQSERGAVKIPMATFEQPRLLN